MPDIVIDVEQSIDARVFNTRSDLIQAHALERLKSLIRETCARTDGFKESMYQDLGRQRTHDAIVISGGRGSGKTTFILSAMKMITEDTEFSGNDSPGRIISLGIIDPTLIETREHIFIDIVAKIWSLIQKARDRRNEEKNDPVARRFDACRDSMGDLARGLSLLDGVGSGQASRDAWDDPQYILSIGIKNASSGEKLERDFHSFIRASLEFLNGKAFVLGFDDIDTDFSRGWPVLEVIRKFLTTPQLIVLLSGDLKLYSTLVRKRQWEHFGAEYLQFESKDSNEMERIKRRVDNLEEQYLLKILKPLRRIEMLRLDELEILGNTVRVRLPGKDKHEIPAPVKLSDQLAKWIETCHFFSKADARLGAECLLRMPVRLVLQVVRATARAEAEAETEIQMAGAFHAALASAFNTRLLQQGFTLGDVGAARRRIGMNTLALKLIQIKKIQHGSALYPRFKDDQANALALVLGGAYAEAVSRTPSLLADYMIKVLLTRDTENELDAPQSLSGYVKHANLEMDETSLRTAQRHAAYTLPVGYSSGDRATLHKGALRLSAPGITRKAARERVAELLGTKIPDDMDNNATAAWIVGNLGQVNENIREFFSRAFQEPEGASLAFFYNTLPTLNARIKSWHRRIANAVSVTLTKQHETAPYLSAFQLLGLFGIFLECDTPDLVDFLESMGAPAMLQAWRGRQTDRFPSDDEDSEDAAESIENATINEEYLSFVKDWREARGELRLPLFVYEKIWTRFTDTLFSMTRSIKKSDTYAGCILHRFAVAFFNAVLVEESLYRSDFSLIPSYSNAVTRDAVFNRNLNYVVNKKSDEMDKLPLFRLVFSCPLWGNILDPGCWFFDKYIAIASESWQGGNTPDEKKEKAKELFKVTYNNQEFHNLHYILNSLAIPLQRELLPIPAEQDRKSAWGRILTEHRADVKRLMGKHKINPATGEDALRKFVRTAVFREILKKKGGVKQGYLTSSGKPLDDLVAIFKAQFIKT